VNARTLLTFLLLGAAVAGSWYLASRAPGQDGLREKRDQPARGFYLRGAVLYGTGEDGTTRYTLRAERIEQRVKEGGFGLWGIDLRLNDPEGTPWLVRAREGSIPEDRSHIQLVGDVSARREKEVPDLSIHADSMRLLTEARIAETDSLVTIKFGQQQVTARGMRAYFNEDRLQLQSEVNGHFVP